ncbi:MAG TPA: Uma2 family endonuclease [Tepidiformaceae bacterium]|nr:Uma2 family endonuclease [Tepidiformaceae bacterium]
MATAMQPATARTPRLPLESGDRLTRAEFERRYACHPEIRRAELIEGVVYVASPVKIEGHAKPHGSIMAWLVSYGSNQDGVTWADNGTVRLDADNEPQPDALLMWDPAHGGQAHIDEDDYVVGAPELAVEVSASSAAYDLHDKLRAYRRNGVREYVVWQVLEERIDWFRLHEGEYLRVEPDRRGVVESSCFPGLRLNVPAMLKGDMSAVLRELGRTAK